MLVWCINLNNRWITDGSNLDRSERIESRVWLEEEDNVELSLLVSVLVLNEDWSFCTFFYFCIRFPVLAISGSFIRHELLRSYPHVMRSFVVKGTFSLV